MKLLNFNFMNDFCIKISWQLISMPGCNSKSWTIWVWPFCEAQIKGVWLNIGLQFQKWFKIGIQRDDEMTILWMIFVFQCFCSWFQFLVVIVAIEQFLYGHTMKPNTKQSNEIVEFNSIDHLKLEYNEIAKFQLYRWHLY